LLYRTEIVFPLPMALRDAALLAAFGAVLFGRFRSSAAASLPAVARLELVR
jgi:hypothetical protein